MICVISSLRKAATSGQCPLLTAHKSPASFSPECQPLPLCFPPGPRAPELSSPQGLLSFPPGSAKTPCSPGEVPEEALKARTRHGAAGGRGRSSSRRTQTAACRPPWAAPDPEGKHGRAPVPGRTPVHALGTQHVSWPSQPWEV